MPTGITGGGTGNAGAAGDANAAAQGANAGDEAKNQGDQGKGPQKPQKKECKKKLSQKDKGELRDATPDRAARKAVNKNSPQNCPACGTLCDVMAADHIVPASMIAKMPGFPCLSRQDQVQALNTPGNFAPLCGPCNSSKRAKLWHRWKGHSKMGMSSNAPVAQNQALTNDLLKSIKKDIYSKPWS